MQQISDKVHRDGLLDMPSDAVRVAGTGKRVGWGEIGWCLGGKGLGGWRGESSEEKLICLQLLSLIAWARLTGSITVNHCGSTRLPRHTIPPPAPRQIISFTSSAWWESLENIPYKNKKNTITQVSEDLLCEESAAYMLRGYLSGGVFILSDFQWLFKNMPLRRFRFLIMSDIYTAAHS